MANYTLTPNMNLLLPTVGVDPGPEYALDVNSSISIIDGHNHAAGYGVQITPAGLNINSDLTIQDNNLTTVRSVRFQPQGAPLGLPADLGCIYESGVDLYYNDGAGNVVRMTQGGSVSGPFGTITGLIPPASASYVPSGPSFVFQSAANTPANLDGASLILRDLVANSPGLTLAPPAVIGTDYTITLPQLPASQSVLEIDQFGNITAVPGGFMPTGAVIPYAGSTAPSGFLLCDGSSYSTTTYANLFAVIGYTFGGSGANFNVPSTLGQMIVGPGGPIGASMGNSGGSTTISVAQLPSHTHGVNDPLHDHGEATGGGSGSFNQVQPLPNGQSGVNNVAANRTSTAATGISIQATGSGATFAGPYICIQSIIKT